ncbi:MAG: MDR family MFS transporter [Pseudolysinimonas sp.]
MVRRETVLESNVTNNVGLRSQRGPVLLAIMVSTALVAIDSTILATAVPSIVNDIGGFSAFPWLFSIYLLAQAVTVPIYSKLADLYGRKPIIIVGIVLFLVGSIMCGFAWSMPVLIIFRAVQGLGAGAVQPMSMIIIADIYSVAERARVQGYTAGVWAVCSVIGPTLGGLFSQFTSWRWIFFVNIPICILAVVLLRRGFREKVERREHRIDFVGAGLLAASTTLIVLGILEGGVAWAWDSAVSIIVFAAGAALLGAFIVVEKRVAEPVLPLWVYSRRLLLTTSLIAFGVGGAIIGLSSYIPTYLEGSVGATPIVAGLALAALSVGWPVASTFAGHLYLRIGFRSTTLIGSFFVVAGTVVLALFGGQPSVVVVALACFVTGFGFGWANVPTMIAAQASVGWSQRGVVTGGNMFARSIGSAVGAAIFGAVANGIIANHGGDETNPATIVLASTGVFIGIAITAGLIVLAVLAMPKTPVATSAPAAEALS